MIFIMFWSLTFKFDGESYAKSFQRSGSMIVLIAGIAEYILFIGDSTRPKNKVFKALFSGFLVYGTVVWGYGDLAFKHLAH